MSAEPRQFELEDESVVETQPAAVVDEKKIRNTRRLKRYRYLLPILIFVAFLAWGFTTSYIPSESMLPTLRPGDHVLTMRSWLAYPGGRMPARGDIVVFALPSNLPNFEDIYPPEEKRRVSEQQQKSVQIPAGSLRRVKGDVLIKRIVGLPGETIQVKGRDIFINGTKHSQRFFGIFGNPIPWISYSFAVDDPITLGPDEVFVLGDNIANSDDGRVWGPLKRRNILGKFVRVLWNDGGQAAKAAASDEGGETQTAASP